MNAPDAAIPLPEYPRPQLRRDHFEVLNGVWKYAITAAGASPSGWDGDILVPFSPETELSGVGRQLQPDQTLWYRRDLVVADLRADERVLLHFGAVDQRCEVRLGGRSVGAHDGGYLPFTLDITDAIESGVAQELVVEVRDVSDTSHHSRGKQKLQRGGIWYTAQSGIWQTVWLERVPDVHVADLRIRPVLEASAFDITVAASDGRAHPVVVSVAADGAEVARGTGTSGSVVRVPVPSPRLWSPEDPHLYDLDIRLGDDVVASYAGMRSVSMSRDASGMPRLFLNGEPYPHLGVLDQGYWADGLYTAPSDDALIRDIAAMKDLGFNMLRKHIKIEPLRWYHHCDRLGMLVWQDMVNGGRSYRAPVVLAPVVLPMRLPDRWYRAFGRQDADGRSQFLAELDETVRVLGNSPSIVAWVPFNEGWGQFDAAAAADRVRALDPDRLIDHASGWHDQRAGDIRSLHVYFRPVRTSRSWGRDGRAVVVSEYGGYSLRFPGHDYPEGEFGYRRYDTVDDLTAAYERLHRDEILPAIARGLSGIVYTQLADVEDESNGLLTADRTVVKVRAEVVRSINRDLRAEYTRVTGGGPT